MYSVHDIADYIISRLSVDGQPGIVNLKLQKLIYYTQAWHLAFTGEPLFNGKFQAWVHGPVNRELYDRFKDSKYLYSSITQKDIITDVTQIGEEAIIHVNNILETYAPYSAIELEMMTHREEPWLTARSGYSELQRCEEIIDEDLMRDYYCKRLS